MCKSSGMQSSAPTILNTDEASEILGIDRSTLTRWAATEEMRERLGASKLPGRTGAWVFNRPDVERVAAELASIKRP